MDTSRFAVSDGMWLRIAGILPGKATDRGVTASDTRFGSGVAAGSDGLTVA